MNRSIRQAVASLRKARSAASWVTCLAHVTYALRELAPQQEVSAKARATRARGRARKADGRRRNEVTDEALRLAVATRAGNDCELEWDYGHLGHEPHHLLSGSARRIDEKPENVMWVCRTHHDSYHRRPSLFIEDVKAWALRNKLAVPDRILRLEQRMASREGTRAQRAPKASPVEHAAVPRRSANGS